MFRLFGGAVGVTVTVIIFYAVGSVATVRDFFNGFSAAMIGAGLMSLVGIIFAMMIVKQKS